MRMVNHTSWPDSKIREIIEFAVAPLNIKTLKLHVNPISRMTMASQYRVEKK